MIRAVRNYWNTTRYIAFCVTVLVVVALLQAAGVIK